MTFAEDKDKETFLDFLERAVERYGTGVYGWCIMENHYHLLISTPERTLSRVMHFIMSGYGSYLRRKRGVIGHIFAGRYKSICVEKENYLLQLSRLHLNPVKAGIVKKPEKYRWSSYGHYIGKKRAPNGSIQDGSSRNMDGVTKQRKTNIKLSSRAEWTSRENIRPKES